ncbi:MAG: hypothetical protein JXC32_17405 [Anaerolineae bacterium]|nr:hypothetical protein [Anaerolineae bacterium]
MVSILPGLSNLLVQLPIIVLWIVGVVVALLRWSRHPRVSLLTLIGLLILLLQSLVTGLLVPWLQITLLGRGMHGSRMGMLMGVVGVVASLIKTGAWGLILVAIFSGRGSGDAAASGAA